MAEEDKNSKKKRPHPEKSQDQSKPKYSEKKKRYEEPQEDSEDDKESYKAEEQNVSDSFDSDFFKPESDEEKEGEFDIDQYLKFRENDISKEIEFGESKDDPYAFLGFEYEVKFNIDEIEYPSLAIYMLVSNLHQGRHRKYLIRKYVILY